jgi:hypothetical protein
MRMKESGPFGTGLDEQPQSPRPALRSLLGRLKLASKPAEADKNTTDNRAFFMVHHTSKKILVPRKKNLSACAEKKGSKKTE